MFIPFLSRKGEHMDFSEITTRQEELMELIQACPDDKILSATIDGDTHIFDRVAQTYTVQTGANPPFFKCSISEALSMGHVLAYRDVEFTTEHPEGILSEVWEEIAR